MASNDADTVIGWKAPKDGRVKISGRVVHMQKGGNGIIARVCHNDFSKVIYEHVFDGSDGIKHKAKINCDEIDVKEGEFIYFINNARGDHSYDSSNWDFTIEYK